MNRAETLDERRLRVVKASKLRVRAISTKCGIYTSRAAKERTEQFLAKVRAR